MKILFLIEELEMTGASKSLLALLEALKGSEYHIGVFLFSHDGVLTKDIPANVDILPRNLAYWVERAPLKCAVVGALKCGRVDLAIWRIVIGFARRFGWRFPGWFMLPTIEGDWDVACAYCDGLIVPTMVRKVNAKKKLTWIHCDYTKYPQSKEVYEAFDQVDGAVSVSWDSIAQFKKAIGREYKKPLYVVHNIIDAEDCRKRAEEGSAPEFSGGVKIASVGRISWPKGFDLIPEMAQKLKHPFEWLIVGDGPTRETLQAKADAMGVGEYVKFVGQRENPMPYVKTADIVVIPSRFEGWGMTLSEALVLGKQVVATDLPVFREQVTDGVNGLLCPLNDVDAYAAAINRLMIDSELRVRLSNEAVKYPFTKARVVEEFMSVIDSVG